MLEKMEAAIETYRRKFAIARHQMGLLYQEHHQEKQVLPSRGLSKSYNSRAMISIWYRNENKYIW